MFLSGYVKWQIIIWVVNVYFAHLLLEKKAQRASQTSKTVYACLWKTLKIIYDRIFQNGGLMFLSRHVFFRFSLKGKYNISSFDSIYTVCLYTCVHIMWFCANQYHSLHERNIELYLGVSSWMSIKNDAGISSKVIERVPRALCIAWLWQWLQVHVKNNHDALFDTSAVSAYTFLSYNYTSN